uniref:Heparan-alpha-glucosaminide N-acetyltransferase n=1 Tax=Leptobrachium leishanense TaxID=445787 RepID=A0A8C5R243_9ANUR
MSRFSLMLVVWRDQSSEFAPGKKEKKMKGFAVILIFVMGMPLQCSATAYELKYDEALLTVFNNLPEPITLLYISDYCYQCLPQLLVNVASAFGIQPLNTSVVISTRFSITLQVLKGAGNGELVCTWSQLYGEHGHYAISIYSMLAENNNSKAVHCEGSEIRPSSNCYLPLLAAFVTLFGLTALYFLIKYIFRLNVSQKLVQKCCKIQTLFKTVAFYCCPCVADPLPCFLQSRTVPPELNPYYDCQLILPSPSAWCLSPASPDNDGQENNSSKSRRLLSLDTFRGFSLTLMIFVNYGGGEYWFFQHAPWNGLTVADLVMPWFVFIIGTSVALAFHSMSKRGVSYFQLMRKLTWRACVLMAIGVFFLNYGPKDGPLSWRWARIPGVLQRLGFTYFTVAMMHAFFCKRSLNLEQSHHWSAGIRDIVTYWPEWIVIAALETIYLCLTFLLPVPGCPKGYLGPGGIGDYGLYQNCTGGAAGYIDKWLLGPNHIYQYPTCKAGKIILIYRGFPLHVLKRFLIWAILLGIISAILTKFTRDEGFIPINKNLWSLSFVTTMGCFSFLLLGLMFYVIDVKHWWGGQPFIYPGMNSIFVYVGHSLLGTYFPFDWEIKYFTSHYEFIAQDLVGTSIWVLVSYILYRKKFFLKI